MYQGMILKFSESQIQISQKRQIFEKNKRNFFFRFSSSLQIYLFENCAMSLVKVTIAILAILRSKSRSKNIHVLIYDF